MSRRNRFFRNATMLTLALGLTAGSAFALRGQCGGKMRGPDQRGPIPIEVLEEKLDLDAETVAAIEVVREDVRDELDKLEVELLAAEQEMRGQFTADEVDPATAMEKAERVEDLRKEIHLTRLECRLRTAALLTPEQRDDLQQLRADRPGRGQRQGRHGNCRMGTGQGQGPGFDQGR